MKSIDPIESAETPPRESKPRPHRGFAFFWVIPVVAVGLTAYLFYQTFQAQGKDIEITFEKATGLTPGKSELRYHGVKVGLVKKVVVSEDLKSIIVHAQFDKTSNNLAREGSKFWIVQPQVNLNGVSGIDTLISGNYIEVRTTGTGSPATKFSGLNHAEGRDPMSPNMFIRLTATTMPSVGVGSAVLFRQMPVGQVVALNYDLENHKAVIDLHIFKEYTGLIRKQTRFWNTSGLDISIGLRGVKLNAGAVENMLFGSISLGLPDALFASSPLAPEGTEYQLFDSFDDVIHNAAQVINETETGVGRVLTLKLPESQQIVPQVTELRYRGIKVGTVVSVQFAPRLAGVLVKVLLLPRPKEMTPDQISEVLNFARKGSRFFLVWPQAQIKTLSTVKLPPDIVQGPYLRIEPGEGEPCTEFTVTEMEDENYRPMEGLRLVLNASQVGKLSAGSPIYYRGVKVGQIESSGLNSDGSMVQIRAVIGSDYAALVRTNTRFWNCSGVSASIGLGGIKVESESLASIMEGGVAFATPDNAQMGAKVVSGTSFDLAEKSEEAWEKWHPTGLLKN